MNPTVMWDLPKLEELKRAREHAIAMKAESFVFEGHEVLVSYAKYLIQYLESELAPSPAPTRRHSPGSG